MGRMSAIGMAGAVQEGQVSLEDALAFHLTSNHFPPVHRDFIPVCVRAIELANDNDWGEVIEMPNGISKTVGEIVDGLHLHAYLTDEEMDADD